MNASWFKNIDPFRNALTSFCQTQEINVHVLRNLNICWSWQVYGESFVISNLKSVYHSCARKNLWILFTLYLNKETVEIYEQAVKF